MKIVVITGSPRKNGISALLADHFSAGAESAGHAVIRFDAASSRVEPCRACDYCRSHGMECIQKDDMEYLRMDLLSADMTVFATPLYYFGMSAQLKRVIDRFYAINGALMVPRKAALLAAAGDDDPSVFDGLRLHYESICSYLGWEDCGQVLAGGLDSVSDAEKSPYPALARRLGEGLR